MDGTTYSTPRPGTKFGSATSAQYITEIRDRRYPVVDEQKGIVFAIVFFEHPGTVKEVNVQGIGLVPMRPFTQKPSSAMIAEVFKIQDGSIRQIEAVVEFLPYGARSGWE